MNPKTPRYAFRITSAPLASKERPLYLLSATDFGRRFEFVLSLDDARWFTLIQREKFARQHSHLRGRWARVPSAAVAKVAK